MTYFGKSFGGGRRGTGRSPIAEQGIATTRTCCSAATVLDVSRTGAKLRGVRGAEVGEEMLLKIGRHHLFGNVRWIHNDSCGVEFDEPIGRFEFEDLRAKEFAGYMLRGVRENRLALEDWNAGMVR